MFKTTMSQHKTPILRVDGKIIGKTVDRLRREMDMQIEDGKVSAFRAKVKISFKFEDGD